MVRCFYDIFADPNGLTGRAALAVDMPEVNLVGFCLITFLKQV
jgi:hypothetical protein